MFPYISLKCFLIYVGLYESMTSYGSTITLDYHSLNSRNLNIETGPDEYFYLSVFTCSHQSENNIQ